MRILPGARGADLKPAFEYIGQIPVLADTAADIVASRASGDHSMFIGHIVDLGTGTPLVVHGERGAALIYLEEAAKGPRYQLLVMLFARLAPRAQWEASRS